jgi:SAM-dependent methyltransferase
MKLLTALYASVTMLSAFLLFLIEPIAARQLLPLFGGSAAVWTTCLVFFQCALLAGYLYAHLLAWRLQPKTQAVVHILLLTAALLSLALRVNPSMAALTWHPVTTLLWLLSATVGLPFFMLAATSPLLQAWYGREAAGQVMPWWLFALSNAGSLLALLVYPALVEPRLALSSQVAGWAWGYGLFAALCGLLALRNRAWLGGGSTGEEARAADGEARAANREETRGLLWILLPGCGSMLLCAVTNHLGQNIAAIPLLWILPLGAYLLSFVVAFASPRAWPRFVSVRMLALTLATFAYLLYTSRTSLPLEISIPVYVLALFFACLFCHGELYRLRPDGAGATIFYLLASFGSALGAILIGVVAPNLFHANHDLAIAAIALAVTALAATWRIGAAARLVWTAAIVGLTYVAVVQARIIGQDALVQLRSFYGSLRVTETHLPPEAETTRTLYHGRIQHGTQLFGNGMRTQPSSYYGRNSGVGLALDLCCESGAKRIGVVGLGTGTIAAYGRAGDEITFYEIDPLVERLARALFTYLRDSSAEIHVVLGDARQSITREVNQVDQANQVNQGSQAESLPLDDVVVLDAFSGDAIPVHLLTAQAIALYRRRLQPDGVLAFHTSSQYLDLAPELAMQAENAGMGAVLVHSDADDAHGIFAADWVLMSANQAFLGRPEIASVSRPLTEMPGLRLWTDDYSSLLPLLKWRVAGAAIAGR